MNASAVADAPPVISNITPRSQVIMETAMKRQARSQPGEKGGLTDHCGAEDGGGEEDVPLHMERLVFEEVLLYNLGTS